MSKPTTLLLVAIALLASAAGAQQSGQADAAAQDLAKQLANPIASLISVPFQFNWDNNIGPEDDGRRYLLNIQPVIPFALSQEWNLISRTILPVIYQSDLFPGAGSQFGLGDTVQSLFFSPVQPTSGGLIWGVGPVFLFPTATDDLLGSKKWGLGPTAIGLKQSGPWTYGALVNHIWSVAGSDSRSDISSTFLQPFVSYTTPNAWTFGLNTETTYNWEESEWTVPLNLTASKLLTFGRQPVSLGGGLRYYADSPDTGPKDWGVRVFATLLFPK